MEVIIFHPLPTKARPYTRHVQPYFKKKGLKISFLLWFTVEYVPFVSPCSLVTFSFPYSRILFPFAE